jgi:protein TonB
MTLNAPGVPEAGFSSLESCLVAGDRQSEKRARRFKQRAMVISIAMQTLALAALVVFPLLGKGERIAFQYATPIPPYAHVGDHHRVAPDHGRHAHPTGRFFTPSSISPTISYRDRTESEQLEENDGDPIPGALPVPGVPGGLQPSVKPPSAPHEDKTSLSYERRKVSELVEMAQLTTRVEPIYPPLAIQTRREGRVELHAVIGADGRIESLEVISGDPFFISSALTAVRQWRYRPTFLNGAPIEVDTHITVIYTLNR